MSQLQGEPVEVFSGQRLSLARRRRGLAKTVLAFQVGVHPRSISNYESGAVPSPDILRRLSEILDFPRAFFFGKTLDEIDASAVSFRSMARMTSAQRDTALGQGALCMHLNAWFNHRFQMPPAGVPSLSLETPEAAAAIVRAEWGLGVQPISNMIHLLESRGVRVYSLSVEAKEVDAFSLWAGTTPFILLNVFKTAEHSRFDAAHELGHLVMHKQGAPIGKEAESEANRFASAFLMPESDLLAFTKPNPSLAAMIQWKTRWKVSLSALNYRMHHLKMTSDYHYRQICIQLSKLGRSTEVNGIPRETSQLLPKVMKMLSEDGVSRSQIAAQLCVTVGEIDSMMFGLAMTSIEGGRTGNPSPSSGKPRLALVG